MPKICARSQFVGTKTFVISRRSHVVQMCTWDKQLQQLTIFCLSWWVYWYTTAKLLSGFESYKLCSGAWIAPRARSHFETWKNLTWEKMAPKMAPGISGSPERPPTLPQALFFPQKKFVRRRRRRRRRRRLEIWGPKNGKNKNSQNSNPFCPKCRQGLD